MNPRKILETTSIRVSSLFAHCEEAWRALRQAPLATARRIASPWVSILSRPWSARHGGSCFLTENSSGKPPNRFERSLNWIRTTMALKGLDVTACWITRQYGPWGASVTKRCTNWSRTSMPNDPAGSARSGHGYLSRADASISNEPAPTTVWRCRSGAPPSSTVQESTSNGKRCFHCAGAGPLQGQFRGC